MGRLVMYVIISMALWLLVQILSILLTARECSYLVPHATKNDGELQENVFLQDETYSLREIKNNRGNGNRSGLRLLSSLYAHRPAVEAKYSSPSPYLTELVERLKKDITVRGITKDPWALATMWASPKSLVPGSAPGLGDLLYALSTAPIIAADSIQRGRQLKILLKFEGNQKAIFKVMRYNRTAVKLFMNSGKDRHNAEIASFHVGRILGLQMVPVAVGRRISLEKEVFPVSSKRLAETLYFNENGQMCFYENKNSVQCPTHNDLTEGVVILWIAKHMKLSDIEYPWRHSYNNIVHAKWESDENYCEEVLSGNLADKILDLVDISVLDFLIQNTDRHHCLYVGEKTNGSMAPIDHGRGFGDPHIDYMDIMAPVLQCCRIRAATYERLVLLSGGGMSLALQELLALDPVAPVLTRAHLRATDRRVTHLLAALSACSDKKGGWSNVLS